jgi:ABC-type branched-subunit amino acid transport system substrate-binding protein
VAQVIKPIAARAKVLHVGICSDTTVADGKFNFINYLTAEQGVLRYEKEFRRRYPAKTGLAIISQNEAGFQRIKTLLEKTDLKLVFSEQFNQGEKDFRSLLLRLKQKKPKVLLLLGLSPEIELIAEQALVLGIQVEFTSIESFGLSNRPAAFEGGWFVDSEAPSEEMARNYQERFGVSITPGVWQSYRTILMLVAGELVQKSVDGVVAAEPSLKEIKAGKLERINFERSEK